MRKLLLLFSVFSITWSSWAQEEKSGEDYHHYFSLQSGVGFTKLIMQDKLGYNNYDYAEGIESSKSAPGILLNWDYRAFGRVSINACLGYNTAKIYGKPGTDTPSEQKGTVVTWSTRLLFNFLYKKRTNMNLYTGFGVGLGVWSYKPDKTYKQIVSGDTDAQFSFPFYLGYRYFFTPNWGATLEASTFKNNLLSAGLTFRL